MIDAHHFVADIFESELEQERLRIYLIVFDALCGNVAPTHGGIGGQAAPAHDPADFLWLAFLGVSDNAVIHGLGIWTGVEVSLMADVLLENSSIFIRSGEPGLIVNSLENSSIFIRSGEPWLIVNSSEY